MTFPPTPTSLPEHNQGARKSYVQNAYGKETVKSKDRPGLEPKNYSKR